jgi:predicted RNase H-like nuclease (RuvC/YqgF family)
VTNYKMEKKLMTATGSKDKNKDSITSFSGILSCVLLRNYIVKLDEKVAKLEEKNEEFKNDLINKNSIIEDLMSKMDKFAHIIE